MTRVFSLLAITAPDGDPEMIPPWAEALEAARVPALQLRRKELDDLTLFRLAELVCGRAGRSIRVLVNSRADIALAAGAEGVHLPASELSAHGLRSAIHAPLLIGRSTHTVEEVRQAAVEGVDYVTFGPVFATPSKPGVDPVGLGALEAACAVGPPVLALGGVDDRRRVREVAAAGAAGAAGIRLFENTREVGGVVALAADLFPQP